MKKLFIIFSLLIGLLSFSSPTFAAEQTPMLLLNQMGYKPQYAPLLLKNKLYMSGPDLAAMTYGDFTQTDNTVTLHIQSTTYIYFLEEHRMTRNGFKYIPNDKIYVSEDQVVYFPLCILDDFSYPYSLSDNTLQISPLMPYSLATDTPNSHHKLPLEKTSYLDLLGKYYSEEEIASLISEAKAHNDYLSLISVTQKDNCYKLLKEVAAYMPQVTVHLRHIDLSTGEPMICQFNSFPLTYDFTGEFLAFKLGSTKLTCNCFWATYNPSSSSKDIEIDIDKSLDVMTMRTLYEYYRDTYGIKDDLSLSPIIKVSQARADYMTYDVYFNDDISHKTYQIKLYKETGASQINYYIDIIDPS